MQVRLQMKMSTGGGVHLGIVTNRGVGMYIYASMYTGKGMSASGRMSEDKSVNMGMFTGSGLSKGAGVGVSVGAG